MTGVMISCPEQHPGAPGVDGLGSRACVYCLYGEVVGIDAKGLRLRVERVKSDEVSSHPLGAEQWVGQVRRIPWAQIIRVAVGAFDLVVQRGKGTPMCENCGSPRFEPEHGTMRCRDCGAEWRSHV